MYTDKFLPLGFIAFLFVCLWQRFRIFTGDKRGEENNVKLLANWGGANTTHNCKTEKISINLEVLSI